MRLIDADLLIEKAKQDGAYDYVSAEEIANAPTIDICKDCDCRRVAIEALKAEPKTGKWKLDPNGMDWNIPAWRCSECGFVANYIGVETNGLGNNPMNWAGSNFCPNCGAKMYKGGEDE